MCSKCLGVFRCDGATWRLKTLSPLPRLEGGGAQAQGPGLPGTLVSTQYCKTKSTATAKQRTNQQGSAVDEGGSCAKYLSPLVQGYF